ncbi:GAF domain-containing protein [Leifsonia flava]|nr:GAF domain-containing protein [Leifsonia flava]
MFGPIHRLVMRSAVALWLNWSQNSWRLMVVAHDSPHVHAPGTDPDRILVTGDGASAGVGVLTHDLGLPGYLARSVTGLTGRATDADIVVTTTMTTSGCLEAISGLQLSRFDVILLSLGGNEALSFANPRQWAADTTRLLDYLDQAAPAATKRIVLSIPYFGSMTRFPKLLAGPTDRYASKLNAITERIVAGRPNVTFLAFTPGEGNEADGAHSYAQWARHLAPAVSKQLQPRGSSSCRNAPVEEASRQRALDELGILNMQADAEIDRLAASARDLFGVPYAAVTLIDNGRQAMVAAIGMDGRDLPRSESFCNVTIRRPQSLAIVDAQRDSRYSAYDVVEGEPRIRFYAGYPIESPSGHRIGALCVMGVQPRAFSDHDSALLRQIAQRVQERLWALSEENAGSDVPPPTAPAVPVAGHVPVRVPSTTVVAPI